MYPLQKISFRSVIKKDTACVVVKATPKQRLIAMVCDSELHTIILWIVISMKLDVGKKMAGLETMTWDCEKI